LIILWHLAIVATCLILVLILILCVTSAIS
jgi:hypothetical protein